MLLLPKCFISLIKVVFFLTVVAPTCFQHYLLQEGLCCSLQVDRRILHSCFNSYDLFIPLNLKKQNLHYIICIYIFIYIYTSQKSPKAEKSPILTFRSPTTEKPLKLGPHRSHTNKTFTERAARSAGCGCGHSTQ